VHHKPGGGVEIVVEWRSEVSGRGRQVQVLFDAPQSRVEFADVY
jgi:hypothetical protein